MLILTERENSYSVNKRNMLLVLTSVRSYLAQHGASQTDAHALAKLVGLANPVRLYCKWYNVTLHLMK